MDRQIGRRLAGHILKANGLSPTFDIDLLDQRSCDFVAKELRRSGCEIERQPHTFELHVTTHEAEA